MNSLDEPSRSPSSPAPLKNPAMLIVIGALSGALLGCGLALSFVIGDKSSDLRTASTVGCLFGGWVGLIISLLFVFVRRLRALRASSALKMLATFTLLGAGAGVLVSFPFSESMPMAIYLGIEGGIAGGLIGAVLGILLRIFGASRI